MPWRPRGEPPAPERAKPAAKETSGLIAGIGQIRRCSVEVSTVRTSLAPCQRVNESLTTRPIAPVLGGQLHPRSLLRK